MHPWRTGLLYQKCNCLGSNSAWVSFLFAFVLRKIFCSQSTSFQSGEARQWQTVQINSSRVHPRNRQQPCKSILCVGLTFLPNYLCRCTGSRWQEEEHFILHKLPWYNNNNSTRSNNSNNSHPRENRNNSRQDAAQMLPYPSNPRK